MNKDDIIGMTISIIIIIGFILLGTLLVGEHKYRLEQEGYLKKALEVCP